MWHDGYGVHSDVAPSSLSGLVCWPVLFLWATSSQIVTRDISTWLLAIRVSSDQIHVRVLGFSGKGFRPPYNAHRVSHLVPACEGLVWAKSSGLRLRSLGRPAFGESPARVFFVRTSLYIKWDESKALIPLYVSEAWFVYIPCTRCRLLHHLWTLPVMVMCHDEVSATCTRDVSLLFNPSSIMYTHMWNMCSSCVTVSCQCVWSTAVLHQGLVW